ncbi:LADA_0C07712g1_1 [Lachancea dasiensis]|uniref:LADA_0C07712g1_1 n=1 Tax=Lachancea dasiensis TaxID=1072105 RepID=A0A1G4IZN6_9SACH|nr:LADA_0C07712g1_1 [Lachancea dasiensis]
MASELSPSSYPKKTQILITDVPQRDFDKEWPQDLQKQLFEQNFPDLKKHCLYYTPLAFLRRVVIIFDEEEATNAIHEYLVRELAASHQSVKIHLTESLLSKPRARSQESLSNAEEVDFQTFKRPQLSLRTDSSQPASPSLSPDRSSSHSPTAMRFPDDHKIHYYQEPLPKVHDEGNRSGAAKLLYEPRLTLNTTNTGQSSDSLSPAPMSPSITLNEFQP